jgi:hypothetical protein
MIEKFSFASTICGYGGIFNVAGNVRRLRIGQPAMKTR